MKTNTILSIVVAVLLIGVVIWVVSRPATPAEETVTPEPTETSGTPSTPEPTTGTESPVIHYTDSGFSPATLTVKQGTTVRFVNDTSKTMWVGSDEHPSHTGYDGTSRGDHCPNSDTAFDQCGAGASYSFTFTKVGSWEYHNHMGAGDHGTVVVTQ